MVQWFGDRVLEKARAGARRGVVAATEAVRAEAVSLILDGEKSGRSYTRGGVTHVASAPGEAPASDTGYLVNSIDTSYQLEELAGVVTAHAEYAPFLEFGTARMAERPFMRPALVNKTHDIERIVADAINEELGV